MLMGWIWHFKPWLAEFPQLVHPCLPSLLDTCKITPVLLHPSGWQLRKRWRALKQPLHLFYPLMEHGLLPSSSTAPSPAPSVLAGSITSIPHPHPASSCLSPSDSAPASLPRCAGKGRSPWAAGLRWGGFGPRQAATSSPLAGKAS